MLAAKRTFKPEAQRCAWELASHQVRTHLEKSVLTPVWRGCSCGSQSKSFKSGSTQDAICPSIYFFCYLEWSPLAWSSYDRHIQALHQYRKLKYLMVVRCLKSIKSWKRGPGLEQVLHNPTDVTNKWTRAPVTADVFQSSIFISARILTPNYLLTVIFKSFIDLNVKWPDFLPGTASLANNCGSPCCFEIHT